MENETNSKKKFWDRGIFIYLLTAYGLTWFGWIFSMMVASKEGYLLPSIDNMPIILENGFLNSRHFWISLLFSAAVYGPLLGSLLALQFTQGRVGVRALLRKVFKWRISLRWYLWAILLAIGLALVPALLACLTGMAAFTWSGAKAILPIAGILLLVQVFTSGLGEEPGWRGYLLPRIQAVIEGENTVWVLGLFWAVWHFPFTAFYTIQMMADVPAAAMAVTIIASLAGQTMSLIGISYLYVWLMNETGSVFLAVLFHALTNIINAVVFASIEGQMTWFVALMPWAVVIILQKVLGKERFPGKLELNP